MHGTRLRWAADLFRRSTSMSVGWINMTHIVAQECFHLLPECISNEHRNKCTSLSCKEIDMAIIHLLQCYAGCYVAFGSIRQIKLHMGTPRWTIFLRVGSSCLQMFPGYSHGISKQLFPTGHESALNCSVLCTCPCHRFQGRAGTETEHQEMQQTRGEGNVFSNTTPRAQQQWKWVFEVHQGHVLLGTCLTVNYEKKREICVSNLISLYATILNKKQRNYLSDLIQYHKKSTLCET